MLWNGDGFDRQIRSRRTFSRIFCNYFFQIFTLIDVHLNEHFFWSHHRVGFCGFIQLIAKAGILTIEFVCSLESKEGIFVIVELAISVSQAIPGHGLILVLLEPVDTYKVKVDTLLAFSLSYQSE